MGSRINPEGGREGGREEGREGSAYLAGIYHQPQELIDVSEDNDVVRPGCRPVSIVKLDDGA